MSQSPLTLTYSGTERFLADWGYSEPRLELVNSVDAPSTFSVQAPGQDPAGAEDIPNWGIVVIRMNRTFSGAAFSGGTIIFVGRRTDYGRMVHPESRATMRVFSDPWYDLQVAPFMHVWRYWNGTSLDTYLFSRLNLFQDISAGPGTPWTYLTTLGQIQQVLTFAASTLSPGANLQTGTIDPTWTVPSYGIKALNCAEVLQLCCRPMADVTKFFDYTTLVSGVPVPTLHIRQRGSIGAQTMPYKGTDGSGRKHVSSEIKSRGDLQVPCVSIQYQINSVKDNVNYTSFSTDTYPVGVSPLQLGPLIVPIDLRGSVTQNITGDVTALSIDPTTTSFWSNKKSDLGHSLVGSLALVDTTINGGSGHPDGITIKDQAGNPVSLSDYPNELDHKGDVASWMKAGSANIVAKQVTITATVNYVKKNARTTTDIDHVIEKQVVTYDTKLTNSAVGAVKYSALQTTTSGDPAITGLAQNIYTSLATLQWEGEHTIFQDGFTTIVNPGLNLNLSGGASAWASMAASISRITVDFTRGTQRIQFGPHKHLTAQQLVEYMLMWRNRTVYDNPSLRNTGQTDQGNTVQMPQDQPVKNTAESLASHQLYTITTPQTTGVVDAQVQLDARLLLPSGSGAGQFPTGLGAPLAATDRNVKLRLTQVCVAGNPMTAVVPRTVPY